MLELQPREELKSLGNIIEAIKSQVNSFRLFHGDNEQLDVLLNHVNLILQKQKCFVNPESEGNGQELAIATTSTTTTATGLSPVFTANETAQLQRMRVALNEIKLHGSAFRFFASEASNLRLFLQNLDVIMTKFPTSSVVESEAKNTNKVTDGCSDENSSEQDTSTSISEFSVLNRGKKKRGHGGDKLEECKTSGTIPSEKTKSVVLANSSTVNSSPKKRKLQRTSTVSQNVRVNVRKKQKTDNQIVQTNNDTNHDDDELFNPSPVQQVMATDLVMMKILGHLSIAQLKLCRQISVRFNVCATRALRRCDGFKVKFNYDWSSKKYVSNNNSQHRNEASDRDRTLEKFATFFKTCNQYQFPCESFVFTGGSLESKDLRDFFCLHGSHVKKLYLDIFCPPVTTVSTTTSTVAGQGHGQGAGQSPPEHEEENRTSTEPEYPCIYSLKTNLVIRLPKVQVLELHNFPPQWKSGFVRLFPEPKGSEILLPNLKFLKLGNDVPSKIFSDLLKAAINLQWVDPCLNFAPILQAKKFYLIYKLMWRPSLEDIELFEAQFEGQGSEGTAPLSQLHYFGICLDKMPPGNEFLVRVSNVTMKLLEASSSTLKEFCIASSLGSLERLKIPQLPNVKLVKVGKFDLPSPAKYPQPFGLSEVYFPPGFQFASSFPHLHTIKFHLYDLSNEVPWEDCFENYEPIPSVKCVVFENSRFLPSGWLAKFSKIFPNLESLEIKATRFKFVRNAQALWSFKRLKVLKFKINLNFLVHLYPAIDAAFTGFSSDTCTNLQDTSDLVDIKSVDGLREQPSIVDCKDLEHLYITFVDLTLPTRVDYPPIMTHVTSLFAFQMCPQLQISFHFKVTNKDNAKKLKHAMNPLLYNYHLKR